MEEMGGWGRVGMAAGGLVGSVGVVGKGGLEGRDWEE